MVLHSRIDPDLVRLYDERDHLKVQLSLALERARCDSVDLTTMFAKLDAIERDIGLREPKS